MRSRCFAACVVSFVCVARAEPRLFAEGVQNKASDAPMSIAMGDWNDDGLPDYAATLYFDNSVSIGFGLGTGAFVETSGKVAVGAFPSRIVTGDWNGDGRPDLAIANADEDNVSILIGEPGGTFRQIEKVAIGRAPRDLAAGDWNGDGRTDLVVASGDAQSASLRFLRGHGAGRFARARDIRLHGEPTAIILADLNDDDTLDVAVSALSGEIAVWHNARRGSFARARTLKTGAAPTALRSADMDGDGQVDLVAATRNGIFIHFGADGGFGLSVMMPIEGSASAVAIADFTADGLPDLAVTIQDRDRLLVLAGSRSRRFSQVETLSTGRVPSWVVAQDLNRDDRTDALVVNHGGKGMTAFLNVGGRPRMRSN